MLSKLIERDREEALRCSTRCLVLPDGRARQVTTYRLVWRWFDHLTAYAFGPSKEQILVHANRYAAEHDLPIDEALARVVDGPVHAYEQKGCDLTDEDLETVIAAHAVILRTSRRLGG